jgi:hypothetical protein
MSRKGGAKECPSDRSCIGPSLTLEEHEITRAKALPRTAAAVVVGMESLVRLVPGPARD